MMEALQTDGMVRIEKRGVGREMVEFERGFWRVTSGRRWVLANVTTAAAAESRRQVVG